MGFSAHFGNGENVEFEEDFDKDVIEAIRTILDAEAKAGGTYMLNPQRVSEFARAYQSIEKHFPKEKYKIKKRSSDLSPDGWYVTVQGSSIEFDDPEEITNEILTVADCFEVQTKLDGTMTLGMSFYGMVKKV